MQVLTRKVLQCGDLAALVEGLVVAVRVKEFMPVAQCGQIADTMTSSPLFGPYKNPGAEKIFRAGAAYFERQTSPEARAEYDRESMSWLRQVRAALAPVQSPIDKLRVELDEVWSQGAGIAMLDGVKLFAGLVRKFSEGSYAEPHQDVIHWDAADSDEAREITIQLAANIYLSMPEKGGELVLWPDSLSQQQYEAYRIPGSYGVKKECLTAKPLILLPEVGELILFNSRKVHAVAPIEQGDRFTFSTFIAMHGPQSRMSLFS